MFQLLCQAFLQPPLSFDVIQHALLVEGQHVRRSVCSSVAPSSLSSWSLRCITVSAITNVLLPSIRCITRRLSVAAPRVCNCDRQLFLRDLLLRALPRTSRSTLCVLRSLHKNIRLRTERRSVQHTVWHCPDGSHRGKSCTEKKPAEDLCAQVCDAVRTRRDLSTRSCLRRALRAAEPPGEAAAFALGCSPCRLPPPLECGTAPSSSPSCDKKLNGNVGPLRCTKGGDIEGQRSTGHTQARKKVFIQTLVRTAESQHGCCLCRGACNKRWARERTWSAATPWRSETSPRILHLCGSAWKYAPLCCVNTHAWRHVLRSAGLGKQPQLEVNVAGEPPALAHSATTAVPHLTSGALLDVPQCHRGEA